MCSKKTKQIEPNCQRYSPRTIFPKLTLIPYSYHYSNGRELPPLPLHCLFQITHFHELSLWILFQVQIWNDLGIPLRMACNGYMCLSKWLLDAAALPAHTLFYMELASLTLATPIPRWLQKSAPVTCTNTMKSIFVNMLFFTLCSACLLDPFWSFLVMAYIGIQHFIGRFGSNRLR